MKNLSWGINAILAIAIVVLYVLHFSGSKSCNQTTADTVDGKASIVYINTDSLLLNYNMAKDLNEDFLKKQEDRRTKLTMKVKVLEKEAEEFQKKLQNNGFLSRERAENAQRALVIKKQSLEKLQQEYSHESMLEQADINKKLFETITNYLTEYNSKHNYELILSTTKGGNVLFAKNGFDITTEILTGLNAQYKK